MSVRIKNVDKILNKITDAFESTLKADQVYIEIVDFTVERIKQKARLSKRMTKAGEQRLPTLSAGYVAWRKTLKPGQSQGKKGVPFEQGATDPQFFRPNITTSNVTFTGQLLDSLFGRILKKGPDVGKIELSFQGQREDGQSNAEVYKELTDRDDGYKILGLDKKAIERIQNICLTRLRQELKRLKLK